jgi:1-acyl-sn-glycerol-3-phosphate acyltransferase
VAAQLAFSTTTRKRLDRVVDSIAGGAMWGWFRSREITGSERLAEPGPVIVVANHSNGFVDPALLVDRSPRPLRFLAKSTLWKVPPVGWLLDLAGALPVSRAVDRAAAPEAPGGGANRSVFSSCHEELARGGAVAVFPEGTVNDTLQLARLHTGAARIALGAASEGTTRIRIVPVGLLYDDKASPRSRALARVGPPIELDGWLDEHLGDRSLDDRALAAELTDDIRIALSDAWTDQTDRFSYATLFHACEVMLRTPDDPGTVPFAASEALLRRVADAPRAHRDEIAGTLGRYWLLASLAGVDDRQVVAGAASASARRVAGRTAVVVGLAPVAAAGAVVNAPAWQVVSLLGRRPMARVSRANFTVLTSLVALPLGWVSLGILLRRAGLRHPWLVALVGGPLSGQAAVAWREQADRLRSTRVGWWRMLRDPEAAAALQVARAEVTASVQAALDAGPAADERSAPAASDAMLAP